MPSWIRILRIAVLLGISPFVSAQEIRFTALPGPILHLSPGETGTLRLRVQSPSSIWTKLLAANAADEEYEFTQVGASEGCAALEPQSWGSNVTFDPTVTGGDLECVYSVRRAIESINDLSIDLWPTGSNGLPIGSVAMLRFGAVPDLRLDVRQDSVAWLPDGHAQSVVTLAVRQSSDVALSGVSAGFCWVGSFPGFTMDGNIPDGCAGPAPGGGFCFDGGYGFQLPTIPAHGAITCRVQLTTREAYMTPLYYPIRLVTTVMNDATTGGHILTLSSAMSGLVLNMDAIFLDRFE